jgi:Domain of unknown function (DUF397)
VAHNTERGVSAPDHTGMTWRKSTYSGCLGNCIEVATSCAGREVALRNSRHPSGPVLIFNRDEMVALVADVKGNKFGSVIC